MQCVVYMYGNISSQDILNSVHKFLVNLFDGDTKSNRIYKSEEDIIKRWVMVPIQLYSAIRIMCVCTFLCMPIYCNCAHIMFIMYSISTYMYRIHCILCSKLPTTFVSDGKCTVDFESPR